MTEQEVIERSEGEAVADEYISLAGERPRRGVKAPRRALEQHILVLLGEHGEMSIGDLHRALLEKVGISYGLVQITVGRLVQGGKLGKIESWPRRYYRQAAQDAATETGSSSPRELVAAALGRGREPQPAPRERKQEGDWGELEVRVMTVARELGRSTLSELHAALLERHNVPYPLMLTAVRNLVSQRYLRRERRADNRYVYELSGDEHI
jgi:predicted transcriptional regulator